MGRRLLSPEARSALVEAFAFHAPLPLKRATSRYIGLPLQPEEVAAGVIFVHVPKNAGTTISTALYGGHIRHRSARFLRACDPEFFVSHPSFAITRDPLSRFRSAFNFARSGGSREVPASESARAFASRFATAGDCARAIASLGPQARDRLDPVFRSQASYVTDEVGGVLVDALLPLEALGDGFEFAGRHFSLSKRRNSGVQDKSEPEPGLANAVSKAYAVDYALREQTL
ncbi:MAG: hypothetical protein ABF313_16945 [Marivita sp.]